MASCSLGADVHAMLDTYNTRHIHLPFKSIQEFTSSGTKSAHLEFTIILIVNNEENKGNFISLTCLTLCHSPRMTVKFYMGGRKLWLYSELCCCLVTWPQASPLTSLCLCFPIFRFSCGEGTMMLYLLLAVVLRDPSLEGVKAKQNICIIRRTQLSPLAPLGCIWIREQHNLMPKSTVSGPCRGSSL